jgi:hypothetical protein
VREGVATKAFDAVRGLDALDAAVKQWVAPREAGGVAIVVGRTRMTGAVHAMKSDGTRRTHAARAVHARTTHVSERATRGAGRPPSRRGTPGAGWASRLALRSGSPGRPCGARHVELETLIAGGEQQDASDGTPREAKPASRGRARSEPRPHGVSTTRRASSTAKPFG